MAYRSDNLKKLYSWSSARTKEVLGGALKSRAAGWKRTESSLIEEALAAYLLPHNKQALFIAEYLFERDSLAAAYEATFHYLEAGPNGVDAVAPNGLPLVESFRDAIFINSRRFYPDKTSGDIPYIASKMDSIAKYVQETDPRAGQYMFDLIAEMQSEPEYFSFFNIVAALLQSWNRIGDRSLTYRVLAALVRLCPEWVQDNETNRTIFLDTLFKISTEW